MGREGGRGKNERKKNDKNGRGARKDGEEEIKGQNNRRKGLKTRFKRKKLNKSASVFWEKALRIKNFVDEEKMEIKNKLK